jgi:hypothetical protein
LGYTFESKQSECNEDAFFTLGSMHMTPGLSEQSKQLRRNLLNHNAPDVMKRMQESGMVHPVGMLLEMTDDLGE